MFQPPINIEEHIIVKVEKRIDPTVQEKPFLLVLEWKFPEGSALYNPDETSRYILEKSFLKDKYWSLEEENFGVIPNQKVGMAAKRYSSVDELNMAYSELIEPFLWLKAIIETK